MADPVLKFPGEQAPPAAEAKKKPLSGRLNKTCLLYTSDAADE